MNLSEALADTGIMAIIRYRDGGDITAAIDALVAGGVKAVEVTVDSPGAWESIASAAERSDLVVGAGTVTTIDQVERLASIGGRFVVSPGLDVDVAHAASRLGMETCPGIATGTEVLAALRAGATFLKLFPAGALGIRYLKELRGPYANEKFIATGGIGLDEIPQWIEAGASAVALGSSLLGRSAPSSRSDRDEMKAKARQAVHAARQARSGGVATA